MVRFSVRLRPLGCHVTDMEVVEGIDENAAIIFLFQEQVCIHFIAAYSMRS